jgi:membrane fusion protein (multidrug efflux system)
MSSPFSRSLRAVESERTRGWVPVAVAAALLAVWTTWFLVARIPLYETSAAARIEATAAAHPVDARTSGRVVRVNLSVGSPVHAGDVLVELEADAERLALDEARARLTAVEPQIASVRREILAEERAIEDERRSAAVARDEQRAILRETQAALGLADEEAGRVSRLRARGIISEQEAGRSRAEVEQRRASSEAAGAALARIDREQKTHESDRLVRIQVLRGTLARLEGEGATGSAAAKRLDYEVERRVLRAPIDGRIAEASELRIGAVVDEGDRLAAIVPEGPLRVVAHFAPASAFGRVRPGQRAVVRLQGFPWAEYGSLHARVTEVATEVRDGFVRVELDVTSLPATLPISHALPGSVEIEVERVGPAWLVLRTLGGLLTRPVEASPTPAGGR